MFGVWPNRPTAGILLLYMYLEVRYRIDPDGEIVCQIRI